MNNGYYVKKVYKDNIYIYIYVRRNSGITGIPEFPWAIPEFWNCSGIPESPAKVGMTLVFICYGNSRIPITYKH